MSSPLVIAHRGASGYLPEHTLAAKAMAHAMGADFLEQDVVLTKDNIPIVLHDIYLDAVTDVVRKFPGRARDDGKHYSIDFTLDEIRKLTVSERFIPATGEPVFPNRFPVRTGNFRIPTLEEELEFIAGMCKSTGRKAGIYPEIKQPAIHHAAGKDVTKVVLDLLSARGYTEESDNIYLQCFDPQELRRVREGFHSRLKLVQLVEEEDWLHPGSPPADLHTACKRIAEYAQGIGPPLEAIFAPVRTNGKVVATPLVQIAHDAGLVVHPWTFRADALPAPFESFEELHKESLAVGIDAAFSDFPDQTKSYFHTAQ